ncbi:MAG: DsbA family protein [Allosphingosinicella sp.]
MAAPIATEPPSRASALKRWSTALVAGLLGAAVAACVMYAASGPVVRAYILDHPDLLPEAMAKLEARETGKVVAANRAAIETPFAGAWAGAKDGDVTLVEFFDYACPYCRRTNADVDRLLGEDPKLKMVWREWPVLGPDSENAAAASLAAAAAGRFKPFHDALFAAGRPSAETIARAAQAAGVAPDAVARTRADASAHAEVKRNRQLAMALRANGTPTFVVGNRVLQGAVGYEALKAAVAEARAPKT